MAVGVSLLAACLAPPAVAQALAPGDESLGAAAAQAARRGDWDTAQMRAYEASSPVVGKVVFWLKATSPDTVLSFPELADFIAANPDWPSQTALRKRAEEMLGEGYDPQVLIAWFERFPPLTTNGRIRLAAAMASVGRDDDRRRLIRQAWIEGGFSEAEEQEFLAGNGAVLTADDHARRLDRLLWDGGTTAAQRMLSRVDGSARAVAEARLRIRSGKGSTESALANVPLEMRSDPGLVFDQVHWYRKNGYASLARSTLAEAGKDSVQTDRFWDERAALAREALDQGDYAGAYRVVAAHGLTDGSDLAEAEWQAGWIALRHLGDPETAARHFETLEASSGMPISKARGAYWAARAREAAGRSGEAGVWYGRSALYPTTFYGQLGAAAAAPGAPLPLPADPQPSAAEREAFERHELKAAADILIAAGRYDLLRPFLLRLADAQPSAAGKQLAADYAQRSGHLDLGVAVAKQAVREGHTLISGGYPTLDTATVEVAPNVETPLVLAIVRQESQFNTQAISPAGARGLMQLMPGTARQVAAQLNIPYSADNLTGDSLYNLQLGQAYIGRLLDSFGGSYVMSLAAYNAGPGRVRQWLRDNGDPRGDVAAAIDWIERIPFSETRNYVQRTIEGLHVYRSRLAGASVPVAVQQDLIR